MLLYSGIEEGWNGPTDLFWRTFLLTIIDFAVHLTFIILTKHPTIFGLLRNWTLPGDLNIIDTEGVPKSILVSGSVGKSVSQ